MVLSGDLTQRARRSQFHAARVFVKRIAVATLVLPGNHDIPLFNLERWDHDAPAQRCTLVDQATISLMKSGERQ